MPSAVARFGATRAATYAALAVYALVRVGLAGFHAIAFSDTAGYLRTAHASLWSERFWAGERSFVVPLVYKLAGADGARIVVQLGFSIVAWSLLAVAVGRCMRTHWGALVGLVAMLAFSTTKEVIGWDPLLLSESMSLSFLALLVAAALTTARRPTRGNAALLVAAAAGFAFSRDANVVVVFVGGAALLVSAARPARRRLKLALALAAIAVVVGCTTSANLGARWQAPLSDVFAYRLADEPGLRGVLDSVGPPPRRPAAVRRAYLRYLAEHPGYTLVAPFRGDQRAPFSSTSRARSLLAPRLDAYDGALNSASRPLRTALDVLWVHSLAGSLVLAAVAACAGVAVRRRRAAVVGLGLLVSAYPAAIAAWHLSGMEIDRHALGAASALRLGAYLLLALAVDEVLARRGARRAMYAPCP